MSNFPWLGGRRRSGQNLRRKSFRALTESRVDLNKIIRYSRLVYHPVTSAIKEMNFNYYSNNHEYIGKVDLRCFVDYVLAFDVASVREPQTRGRLGIKEKDRHASSDIPIWSILTGPINSN